MKYISELAYANLISQTNRSIKDKKQKNKYHHSELLDNNNNIEDEAENEKTAMIEQLNSTLWQGDDRRDGTDRREIKQSRGRYLDSRETKDRRFIAEFYIKI